MLSRRVILWLLLCVFFQFEMRERDDDTSKDEIARFNRRALLELPSLILILTLPFLISMNTRRNFFNQVTHIVCLDAIQSRRQTMQHKHPEKLKLHSIRSKNKIIWSEIFCIFQATQKSEFRCTLKSVEFIFHMLRGNFWFEWMWKMKKYVARFHIFHSAVSRFSQLFDVLNFFYLASLHCFWFMRRGEKANWNFV